MSTEAPTTTIDPETRRQRAADIAIYGSRENSNRGNEIQLKAEIRNLSERLATVRKREGADAHFIGTVLARLWHARADEVFGFPSFEAFARDRFGLSRASAYRYVRVAAYATASESEWGVDTCLVLAAIVDLVRASPKLQRKFKLGADVDRIGALSKVEFPLPRRRTLRLQAGSPVSQVDAEALLESLRRDSGLDPGGLASKADRGEAAALQRAIDADGRFPGVTVHLRKKGGRRVMRLEVPEGMDLVRLARTLVAASKAD